MRLICPACGALASLESWLADGDARAALALAAALPAELGPRVVRYLGLFRPAKRGLAWDRAHSLLAELAAAIAAGAIERERKRYEVGPAAWAEGLDTVLAARPTLDLPLRSHGYLYEILASNARRTAARADQHAAAATTPLHPSHRPAASPLPLGEGPGVRVPAEPSTAEILAEHDRRRTRAVVTDAHGQPATPAELRQRWRARGGQGTGAANPLRQLSALLAGAGVTSPPPEDTPDAS